MQFSHYAKRTSLLVAMASFVHGVRSRIIFRQVLTPEDQLHVHRMITSLALVLLCAASGTILTYLYDNGASFVVRVCTGVCVGVAALGLFGFVLASFIGLTNLSVILLAGLFFAAILLVVRKQQIRRRLTEDWSNTLASIGQTLLHPTRVSLAVLLYLGVIVILWRVFDRAVIEDESGLSTGVLNNFGDLPFHLSVITSFVFGNNFPPEDPTYAGVRFTYPFLTDFVSAIFVRCGATLRESMFLENVVIAVSLVGLIHRWAWELLRQRLAAFLTPLLVLLNGGFGFVLLWTNAKANERGLIGTLQNLPPSFTVIPETTWRWGNAISTLLIPQRGILLGLALSVIVFTQWWLSEEKPAEETPVNKKKSKKPVEVEPVSEKTFPARLGENRMIAAGAIAGLLPLVHAHSFVVVMTMGAGIALLRRRWTSWLTFFLVASIVALPQMWWSTYNSSVDASKFFEWQFGWDRGQETALWFWFKNTGLFIPLIVVAILWRSKEYLVPKRLLLFYLPFTLCFIVPNMMKMAPWVWDNIKVLYYWWVASAPLVALLLARLWQQKGWQRVLGILLFIGVTFAGALDVVSIAVGSGKFQVFDRNGIAFAELIKEQTSPRSLIIHAAVHNAPVFLTGRRSLMGYPGHIWTHGLEFTQREREIRRIYAGDVDAKLLLQHHKIEYAVVSPLERNAMPVNEEFFTSFQKVGEVGAYRLYKTTP